MTKTGRTVGGVVHGIALIWLAPGGGNGAAAFQAREPFQLREKDHIAIIGNTLAERMQYDGWLETLMHARFPKHDLVIRNLGWSGDTVTTRLRSKNFGTPDEWLSGEPAPIGGYTENRFAGTNTKADVIFAFFGYNESYAGQEGLERVQEGARRTGSPTRSRRSTTASRPRASCSFRRSRTKTWAIRNLPDGRENNQRLALYTKAMAEVAAGPQRALRRSVHAERRAVRRRPAPPLTINGVHLNGEGNRRIAEVIDRDLFGAAPATNGT